MTEAETVIETRLYPVLDRIIVRPEEQPDVTGGGVILPENRKSKPKPAKGEVLAVGPDVPTAKAGDVILFVPFAGVPIEHAGETLMAMKEEDVIAIVREGPFDD
jgi:co-chaperonin GroES (HSP10)